MSTETTQGLLSRNAVSITKKKSNLFGLFKNTLRVAAFIGIGFPIVFHIICIPLMVLMCRLKIIKFYFVVTPGSKFQVDHFCPGPLKWFAKWPRFIDLFMYKGVPRGIVLATSRYSQDLKTKDMQKLVAWMTRLCRWSGVGWTFSGSNPSIMDKKKITCKYFISGQEGVVKSICETMFKNNITKEYARIAIIGEKGYVGRYVFGRLCELGYSVIGGFDKKGNDLDQREITLGVLKRANTAIVVTAQGRDIKDYIELLKSLHIDLIDDTHPSVPREMVRQLGEKYHKVYSREDGMGFFWGLPGFGPDDIPGCCREAIDRTINNS